MNNLEEELFNEALKLEEQRLAEMQAILKFIS
jgi:hypothetical protein